MSEIQQLERAFRYNSVDLPDPGPQYTTEQVRDFYAATYPEIVSAAIEGPEEKDGRLLWTFRKAVGTKGSGDTPRPALARLREDHATVPQLLALAKLDSDPISFFTDGTSWADASAAFVIIKGGRLAREIFELFERRRLVTPGKAVVDLPADLGDLKPDETVLVIDLHPLASAGVTLIAHERKRQVEEKGYDAAHDDEHEDGSLAMAGALYAAPEPLHAYRNPPDQYMDPWPWDPTYDKRKYVGDGLHTPARASKYTLEARIRMLAKAGALIAAEIDRLTRLQKNRPAANLDPATSWPFPSTAK